MTSRLPSYQPRAGALVHPVSPITSETTSPSHSWLAEALAKARTLASSTAYPDLVFPVLAEELLAEARGTVSAWRNEESLTTAL